MALGEEEEKHQERCGREPPLSCRCWVGLRQGSFIRVPFTGAWRGTAGPSTLQHLRCHTCGAFSTITDTTTFLRHSDALIALTMPLCHLGVTWGAPQCHHCHQGWELPVPSSSVCCEGSCEAAGRATKGLFWFQTYLAPIQSLCQGLLSVASTTSCCRAQRML